MRFIGGCFLFGVIVLLMAADADAQGSRTCSFQNAKCMDFCQHTRQGRAQGRRCTDTCRSRQRVCLTTGVYEWRNSPNVEGLERR